MKQITLCADDFAYSEAVSHGIYELATNGRINAISCMSTRALWPAHAKLLHGLKDCRIGLHINLTETPNAHSHMGLTAKAYLGLLSYDTVYQNIKAQFDVFCEHRGRAPDFLDGHQHIHQLPTVRRALIQLHQTHCDTKKCVIRLSANPMFSMLNLPYTIKQSIIYGCGYRGLKSLLHKHHIQHNSSFAGIYPFDRDDYRTLFQQFLAFSQDGGLIMCHPGLEEKNKAADPLWKSRFIEFRYFQSDAFIEDCQAFSSSLVSL